MLKYLVGFGALVVITLGYLMLFHGAPATAPREAATAPRVAAPAPKPATDRATENTPRDVVPRSAAAAMIDEKVLLETMAADTRERLPSTVTDALTMTDALFLPRMRIMEYTYVTSAADARASAQAMRAMIETDVERLCLQGRTMFEMGVTLRNSFRDREGTLFQRVYLLPEDCQQFY